MTDGQDWISRSRDAVSAAPGLAARGITRLFESPRCDPGSTRSDAVDVDACSLVPGSTITAAEELYATLHTYTIGFAALEASRSVSGSQRMRPAMR